MDKKQTECPNCRQTLDGSKHAPLDEVFVKLINEYGGSQSSGYCVECGSPLYIDSYEKYVRETEKLTAEMVSTIEHIPILTTTRPLNWDFEEVTIVTSRVTLGTGFLFSIGTGLTDIIGAESEEYNAKIEEAEKLAFRRLRMKAWEQDCNAVIAVDIDLENVGGKAAMLLLNVSGTAVRLKDTTVLSGKSREQLEKMKTSYERLKYLRKLRPPVDESGKN